MPFLLNSLQLKNDFPRFELKFCNNLRGIGGVKDMIRMHATFAALGVFAGTAFMSAPAAAESCRSTSIAKPSPFMGNDGEIFALADGSYWQVKYEYEYLYEYFPTAVICPSENILIIKGKKLNVVPVSPRKNGAPDQSSEQGSLIESRIDGDFKGWEGDTIYMLVNGQIWQQSSYHYHYHYAYSPEVMIYREGASYKMIVVGDDDRPITVRRIK